MRSNAGNVVIPFWEEISTPERPEPRLIEQFCSLIQSFAFLDAENREKDTEIGAIIANWNDFHNAAALLNSLIKNEGGSQRLKLTPDENKILDYLLEFEPTSKAVFRGTIEAYTGLNDKRVSRALIGRADRKNENDLTGKTAGIEIGKRTIGEDNETTNHDVIHWNPDIYKQWLRGEK